MSQRENNNHNNTNNDQSTTGPANGPTNPPIKNNNNNKGLVHSWLSEGALIAHPGATYTPFLAGEVRRHVKQGKTCAVKGVGPVVPY